MKDSLETAIESHRQELRDLLASIPPETPPVGGGPLLRSTARERFLALSQLLDKLKSEIDTQDERIERIEEELEDARGDTKRLEELINMVRDVDRRVVGGRELINYVKETYPL